MQAVVVGLGTGLRRSPATARLPAVPATGAQAQALQAGEPLALQDTRSAVMLMR